MTLLPLKEGKIWHYKGKVITTDYPNSGRWDSVFPLRHENTYLAKKLAVKKGDNVLDLCTGSGIIAIFAAEKAGKVYATDINPRALLFAEFNSKMNGTENKIEFRQGDLFGPVKGMKFDLITANPPFEPVPKEAGYYLHSAGGEKGTKVLEKILSDIENHLKPGGSFQIIAWIPESKMPVLEKITKENYENIIIKTLRIFSPEEMREYLGKMAISDINISEPTRYLFIQGFGYKVVADCTTKG
ncbi:MAG: HemK2/MTQ2 family protein methyltransferase [Candidatus Diapherotrites archaeon]